MDSNIIGKKLQNLRGSIPVQEVAESIGVSVSAIRMYENGQRIPRDETKLRYAEYFDTTVEDIFFSHNYT